eukprot:602025-Rhodomonas_salina.1
MPGTDRASGGVPGDEEGGVRGDMTRGEWLRQLKETEEVLERLEVREEKHTLSAYARATPCPVVR